VGKYDNKTELIKCIKKERRLLEKTIAELSREEMSVGGVVGEWSVKDILAHLMAWEKLFLTWYESGIKKKAPEIPPVGMSRKAIAAVNEQFYHQHERWHLDKVLVEFHSSYETALETIEKIREEDIFMEGRFTWTEHLVLAQYIAGNTCDHYVWARSKIRHWVKQRNPSR